MSWMFFVVLLIAKLMRLNLGTDEGWLCGEIAILVDVTLWDV